MCQGFPICNKQDLFFNFYCFASFRTEGNIPHRPGEHFRIFCSSGVWICKYQKSSCRAALYDKLCKISFLNFVHCRSTDRFYSFFLCRLTDIGIARFHGFVCAFQKTVFCFNRLFRTCRYIFTGNGVSILLWHCSCSLRCFYEVRRSFAVLPFQFQLLFSVFPNTR